MKKTKPKPLGNPATPESETLDLDQLSKATQRAVSAACATRNSPIR